VQAEVAAVTSCYEWRRNCVVNITRPQTSWLKKLVGRTAQPIGEADVTALMKRVSSSARVLLEWEQGGCDTFGDVIAAQVCP
jgi:hypothetical protein